MKTFNYPFKTTVPPELGPMWEDRSYRNDASPCCWLDVPTKKHPKAILVLWVQPDDKAQWELPEQDKYQLDHVLNKDEGWEASTDKTLLITDDLAKVLAEVRKHVPALAGVFA